MTKFTDDTPIAMLTVGQLKEILGIDRILGNLTANQAPRRSTNLQANERSRFASRSMAEGGSTFSVRRFSTGCRANHIQQSNNIVITILNIKQSKL